MTREDVAARIQQIAGDRLLELRQSSDKRLWAGIAAAAVPDATRLLYDELGARLQTASGVDGPREIEILYHWALDAEGLVVSLRTRVERNEPRIDSITAICPAAEWIEREMWELLGIEFTGHPNLEHLLLKDDWPAGQYPLRRDYRRED